MELFNLDWRGLEINFDEPERCGVVVTQDNELRIQEVPNRSSDPDREFVMLDQDLEGIENICATWHSHPRGPLNLSIDDYNTFVDLPHLKHIILTPRQIAIFGMHSGWLEIEGRQTYER